jgi:hypothetical protein
MVAAGGSAADAGLGVAAEVEARMDRLSAAARFDHGATLLAGFDVGLEREQLAPRWDDRCVTTLREHAATERCWTGGHPAAGRIIMRRALAVAAGVRRDGSRYDAIGELQIHPARDQLADVIELGVTAPLARGDMMYVHHARYAPGWLARAQWRFAMVRIGGELGMTGLATRDAMGSPRADTYALATLTLAVEL